MSGGRFGTGHCSDQSDPDVTFCILSPPRVSTLFRRVSSRIPPSVTRGGLGVCRFWYEACTLAVSPSRTVLPTIALMAPLGRGYGASRLPPLSSKSSSRPGLPSPPPPPPAEPPVPSEAGGLASAVPPKSVPEPASGLALASGLEPGLVSLPPSAPETRPSGCPSPSASSAPSGVPSPSVSGFWGSWPSAASLLSVSPSLSVSWA